MPLSRISSQAIANNTIISADVVDYSLSNTKLANTSVLTAGASRGTYGGGSSSQVIVPIITVANSGQVFQAANQILSLTTFGGITATDFSSSGVLIGSSITSNSSIIAQSLSGSSLTVTGTTKLQQAKEKVTLSSTTSSFDFDALTASIVYFQTAGGSNFTVNFRGNGSTSLNSLMSDGESMTFVILVNNTSPATYPTSFTIDSQAPGISKWTSPGVPTGGNTNAIDAYTITIIKRASATFTLLGTQTKFG